jgi:4-hydroxythreonine-4-phosphate dehydrogenase
LALPRIAITVGDPAGIGPEVAEKAAADPRVLAVCEPVLYGPAVAIRFEAGRATAEAGRAAYDAIVSAARDARAGAVAAIATAPVSKTSFAMAGLPWKGHTDLLGHLCGVSRVAMMFYSPRLRVVLATVHVALRDVAGLLSGELLDGIIDLTAEAMPRFGHRAPRIAMAGLNPHAGEHGLMGVEDDEIIRPAVARAAARGVAASGPWPADTVFVRALRGEFDVVVACYHDQGLIPMKLVAFGSSVNVTLGLPLIRTSVDHGTAFDIAGRGLADPGSMIEAVLLAARLTAAESRE